MQLREKNFITEVNEDREEIKPFINIDCALIVLCNEIFS
jgi:hypothetical protein